MSSIEKRGKTYRAVVSVMRDGVRRKVSKSFGTKKEALNWSITIESNKIQGKNILASSTLFPDYFEFWMNTYKKNSVREATFATYKSVHSSITNLFHDMPLANLTTYDLQTKVDEFGKNHLQSTTRILVSKIKACLKDALYDESIKKDIYSRLKANGNRVDKKRNSLNANEFESLRNYLYSKELNNPELAILIGLETGARIGEIIALTQSDISIPFQNININKSRMHTKPTVVTPPKNTNAIRNIKVPIELMNKIKKHNNQDEMICYTMPSTVRDALNNLISELNLTPITVHGLRHSHASYLLYKGVSINYVSKRLGHANISITQQVYAHMLYEEEVNETERTLKLLSSTNQDYVKNSK